MTELNRDAAPGANIPDAAAPELATVTVLAPAPIACRYEKLLLGDDASRVRMWKCPHPVELDGLCLHHLPKPTGEARTRLDATQLNAAEQLESRCRTELAAMIAQTEQHTATISHEFIGFELPPAFGLTSQALLKPVNFRYAHFTGDATFVLAELHEVDFRDTEFIGRATFAYVKFHGSTKFHDACFHAAATFSSNTFHGRTYFAGARFKADCEFSISGDGFLDYASFDNVSFAANATFVGYGDKPGFHGRSSFCKLRLGTGSLSFTKVSLAKADFYDTELQRARFIDVHWNSLSGRPSLWGEVRLLKIDADPATRQQHGIHDWEQSPQIDQLAENYAQLVLTYEQRRDVDMAEAFHIGEMEMRRRRIASHIKRPIWRGIRERCNGFSVYRWSSNYGTSYFRAMAVLAGIILLLSLLFLRTGIAPVSGGGDSYASAPTAIKYQLLPDASHPLARPSQWLDDYSQALMFTLSIATFQKDRFYQPASRASQVVVTLTVLLIGAQATLLLFAIRRRFKR